MSHGCEKCWQDAYVMSRTSPMSQVECYEQLLAERDGKECKAWAQAQKRGDDQ